MPNTRATPLPMTLDEIDAAWLTDALADAFPGAVVTDFEIGDVRHGFTTVARVRLTLDDTSRTAGVPETVMVKGGFEEWSRVRARTYAVEALAYRDLWPHIQVNVPEAYFAAVDEQRKQAVIVMEDLTRRPVRFGAGMEPFTYPQVARSLAGLAAFHAQTWNSPELEPGGRFGEVSMFEPDGRWAGVAGNAALMMRDTMYQFGLFEDDVFARLAQLPRGAAQARRFHDVEWAKQAFSYISALGEVLPNCIVHGDTHLGNTYEEADGTPGWFDPMPHKEPAFMELAYHITCALDPADRKQWDHALVAHYLSELERNGVEPPSFDDTMRHFAAYLTYGFYVFFINDTKWQTEAFNTAHAMRFSAAMIDHDTYNVVISGAREPAIAKIIAALPDPPPFKPSNALEFVDDAASAGDPHIEQGLRT